MQSYDPSQVSIIIGTVIAENWESVSVDQDEDSFTLVAGASGEVTRTKNSNRIGTIELIIKQSSVTNPLLTALHDTDSIMPIEIVDKSGNSLHAIPQGTITKPPTGDYGKELADRTWLMKGRLDINLHGGN